MSYMCTAFNGQKESLVFFFKDLYSVADSLSTKALVTYVPSSRPIAHVAMYSLENRYCVKQNFKSKNENEKKEK